MNLIQKIYPLFIVTALLFTACKEEPPYINFDPPKLSLDTAYIDNAISLPQPRMILVEDISGVKCVNCPEAQEILHEQDSMNANPERINIIAVHPALEQLTPYVKPMNENKYDFRSAAGATICNMLGIPGGLPAVCIDRVKYGTDPDYYATILEIVPRISQRLSVTTPVNITMTNFADAITPDQVSIEIIIKYTQQQLDSNYLSIALVEDSIIDPQETQVNSQPPYVIHDYVHMHVLRDMFTAQTGDLLNKDANSVLVPGRVFQKRYFLSTKNAINGKKHLYAVAFVHKSGGSKEILHSAKLRLQ